MINSPKELHSRLVHPSIAAPVVLCGPFLFTESTDADAVAYLFYAPRAMRFVGGSYIQSVDATAATSYTAQVEVGTQVLSAALDIKTLAAATVAYFTPSLTSADRNIAAGDRVEISFNETGGTATSPEAVEVYLQFQLID